MTVGSVSGIVDYRSNSGTDNAIDGAPHDKKGN
jgi:hypothetical protein